NSQRCFLSNKLTNEEKQYLKSCFNSQLIAKIETHLTWFIKEDNSFVYDSENQKTDGLDLIYKDIKLYAK
ncbi:3768_t:CDS:1, partial [Gigaspora margarita]